LPHAIRTRPWRKQRVSSFLMKKSVMKFGNMLILKEKSWTISTFMAKRRIPHDFPLDMPVRNKQTFRAGAKGLRMRPRRAGDTSDEYQKQKQNSQKMLELFP
ncbi:MAG: hypothetical protein K6F46_03455, partial [Desulfovibrio sp.]|nr:hypothetical protein [Desulfovibrio sp.]